MSRFPQIARSLSRLLPIALVVGVAALWSVGSDLHAQSGRVVDHDFVGADRCKSCHTSAHTQWQNSAHARAMDALSPKEQQDARCLSCHTTLAEDTSAPLAGVQCEACHGPGRYYALDYVMRDAELRSALLMTDPSEQTCQRCHTDSSPSLHSFVYGVKREAIRHWASEIPSKTGRP